MLARATVAQSAFVRPDVAKPPDALVHSLVCKTHFISKRPASGKFEGPPACATCAQVRPADDGVDGLRRARICADRLCWPQWYSQDLGLVIEKVVPSDDLVAALRKLNLRDLGAEDLGKLAPGAALPPPLDYWDRFSLGSDKLVFRHPGDLARVLADFVDAVEGTAHAERVAEVKSAMLHRLQVRSGQRQAVRARANSKQ